MNYQEILDDIYQKLPDLKNSLTLDHVSYIPRKEAAVLFLTSHQLVTKKEFDLIKKRFQKAFPRMPLSLRIASPDLAVDFISAPGKYADVFAPILLKHFPAMTTYLHEVNWLSERESTIILELPTPFAFEYMQKQEVQQKLSDAIEDIFLIRPPIELRLRDDFEKRILQQMQEREREDRLMAAKISTQKPASNQKKKNKKIMGSMIAAEPVSIKGLTELSGKVVVQGKVSSVESRKIQRSNSVLLLFVLSDETDSILCKTFLGSRPSYYNNGDGPPIDPEAESRKIDEIVSRIKPGIGLKVRGNCQDDNYERELVILAQDINQIDLETRKDLLDEKRVELHAHTHMSFMDGLMSASDLIKRAADFGHKAIAITDHGVVQAFPEAFVAAKKNNIKLIPGMEGTMMDDQGIVLNPGNAKIADPIIVLDFETTGLNPQIDRIIEIGAVKLVEGQIADSLSMLVNPGVPLSEDVIRITGIQDHMLMNEPGAEVAMPKLLAFIGNSPLAAHNASFDIAFLDNELKRLNKEVKLPQLDTLAFAQKLYPGLKRFNLGAICKHLGVSLKNAHRAVQDATATAQVLTFMLRDVQEKGAISLADINELLPGYNRNNRHHILFLVSSQVGMRNLNRLVSLSHMRHFFHEPLIPRDKISAYREGLLLGSACWYGELYQAAAQDKPMEELLKIAEFYDFIEVQPIENYLHLIKAGRVFDEERLREITKLLIDVGERSGIPVIATGDAHFLDPEDIIFRAIIHNSLPGQTSDVEKEPSVFFRNTEEMLTAFQFLGSEKAREIVVTNPSRIVEMTEPVTLYPAHPDNKTTFAPVWDSAADDIRDMATQQAKSLYGDPLPKLIQHRLDKELNAIVGYGYATLYSIAQKLVKKSLDDGYLVGSRGSVGSSFVATMCGITEVNPLPPHYSCTECKLVEFDVPKEYQTGIDLPEKVCSGCGKVMQKDGYDIPFEVFLGFEGDKVPDIDLNFCSEYQSTAHAQVEELFGQGYVFRAGTIGTLKDKTAFGLVLKYLEEHGLSVSNAEKTRLANGLIGVKRTTGQHPGGMVILPKNYEINQFTAIQRPANDQTTNIITTHFDFASMHDILVKVDVLGHDDPMMIRRLEDVSGIHYNEIPLDDPKVLSLFRSPEALGLTRDQLDCTTGTLGIPEFGTAFVRGILNETQPESMADLVRISGLSHGTDVWLGNARDLIINGTAKLSECICTREDIMLTLIDKGLSTKMAFDIMESVRKGRGLTPTMEQAMRENDVPEWFLESCRKIAYMFPKGHAVAYVTMALRVGWFKVHHPLAYYCAYFSIRGSGFNALTMVKPAVYLKNDLDALNQLDSKDLSEKNKDEIVVLELAYEMALRGFSFLPVDLYRSDATKFIIEGDGLRCPFTSMPGFGESAAQGIVGARSENFISIEDLRTKARLSTSAIDLLKQAGALAGMQDTNQVSFFTLM